MIQSEPNPFQSPQVQDAIVDPRRDEPPTLESLERRIRVLEETVRRSWFLRGFVWRSLATFGHWIVGYALMGVVFFIIMAIIWGGEWMRWW
jgi:hypothetical protein